MVSLPGGLFSPSTRFNGHLSCDAPRGALESAEPSPASRSTLSGPRTLERLAQGAVELLFSLPENTVYALVIALCWAEAAFFLGFVTPGELAIATGGVLASHGQVSLPILATAAVAGTILGNSTGYWIGRLWGPRLLDWPPLQRPMGPAINTTRSFLERRGEWAIVLGRLATVTRIVVPFLVGASRVSYGRFLAFDTPSVVVWASGWTVIGFLLGESWHVLWDVAGSAAFLVLILIVLALVIRWVAVRVAANQRRVESAARNVLRATGLGALARPLGSAFRWLSRRLDPRLAQGLNVTLGFMILMAGSWGAWLVLSQTQAVRGLALLDFPVLEWMSATRTDDAVRISRGFLRAFDWPGMLGLAAVPVFVLGSRLGGGAAIRVLVGILGSGIGALAVDRLVLDGVVPRAEFPSVSVAVSAALLVHVTAGAAAWGGWGHGVAAAAVGTFLTATVALATIVAGWSAPSGIVLGLTLGIVWCSALELQAVLLRGEPSGQEGEP